MKPLSFLLLSFILFACSQSACSPSEEKRINVVGQAKIKVVPNMVELSLRSDNVRPAMKNAVAETQLAVNEMIAVCRKYISDSSDVKVSNISTNKYYDYPNGRETFKGFQAVQVLDITLRDITKLEKFAEELLATRVSRIDNVRYNHTKADSIMREVNLMALEDARMTAEKMCSKMNVQLGDIIYLSNFDNPASENSGIRYTGGGYNMELYSKSFAGRGFKMTAEILEFIDMAYARFKIK